MGTSPFPLCGARPSGALLRILRAVPREQIPGTAGADCWYHNQLTRVTRWGYYSVSEEGSTQGQEIDSSQYETLIDETFSYADLTVHSANGPYAIDNPRVRGGATLKNGAAPAVLATIICNNGTSSSVNFSQALRIEATQGGNELSILDAASFVEQVASYDPGNSSVDGDFESYAYIDGRDIEIPYIDAPGHEVDPGDSYAYPFAVLPENEEEDILVSVFLADNDSYPIYTMTIEPRDWL